MGDDQYSFGDVPGGGTLTSDSLVHGHIVRSPDEGAIAHIWQLLMMSKAFSG